MRVQVSEHAAKLIRDQYGDRFYDELHAFLKKLGSEGAWVSKAHKSLEIWVWPPEKKVKT